MAIDLTEEQKKAIREQALLKLERLFRMNANGTGTPAWKSLFFLMDHMSRGDFFGTIQVKILGCVVKDPRYVERTFKLDDMYRDIEQGRTVQLSDQDRRTLADISAAIATFEAEEKEGP